MNDQHKPSFDLNKFNVLYGYDKFKHCLPYGLTPKEHLAAAKLFLAGYAAGFNKAGNLIEDAVRSGEPKGFIAAIERCNQHELDIVSLMIEAKPVSFEASEIPEVEND